jgi:predicted DNA binding CopG/RHH family protein
MTQRAKSEAAAKPRPPRFRDEAAEREFWATHDSADYVDWARARRVSFPNLKPSTESISLRLPSSLLGDLKVLANRMDVPYQSLLKVYLAERVDQELRRDRQPEELAAMVREPEPPYGDAPAGTHRQRERPARKRRR